MKIYVNRARVSEEKLAEFKETVGTYDPEWHNGEYEKWDAIRGYHWRFSWENMAVPKLEFILALAKLCGMQNRVRCIEPETPRETEILDWLGDARVYGPISRYFVDIYNDGT